MHMMDVLESVCGSMKDYAQARVKVEEKTPMKFKIGSIYGIVVLI